MNDYIELARHVRHDLIKNLDIPASGASLSVPELRVFIHRVFEPTTGMCDMTDTWIFKIRRAPEYVPEFEPILRRLAANKLVVLNAEKQTRDMQKKGNAVIADEVIVALSNIFDDVHLFEDLCNRLGREQADQKFGEKGEESRKISQNSADPRKFAMKALHENDSLKMPDVAVSRFIDKLRGAQVAEFDDIGIDEDSLAALDFMGFDFGDDTDEDEEVIIPVAKSATGNGQKSVSSTSSKGLARPSRNTVHDLTDDAIASVDDSKIRVLVVDDQLISIERLQARASMQSRFSWVTMCQTSNLCTLCEHADCCERSRARSWFELTTALRYEQAHGGRVDLLLMDVRFDTLAEKELLWIPEIPALNDIEHVKALQGLIIARALHRDPEFSKIPIILMTSLSRLPDGANHLLEGLEGLQFVDDDDSLDALATRMEGVVRQKRALDQSALEINPRFFWGNSPKMQNVRRQAELMSFGPRTVLITGPSGSGKSYIVDNVIYPRSGRHPLVTLDLSAVPENLVESELFGHVKGAFSGATHDRPGLIEEAKGGILFLDEIGNLSLENQKKLLLFLNDKMVRRVGAAFSTRHHVDVKVVAATHLNLAKEVEAGRFRFDLYMRLAPAMAIELPTLDERRSDLGNLVKTLVTKIATGDDMRPYIETYAARCHVVAETVVEFGTENNERISDKIVIRFNQATRELFESYAWPGNTRELESILDALVLKTLYDAQASTSIATTLEIDHYFALSLLGKIDESSENAQSVASTSPTPDTWMPNGPFSGFSEMRQAIERAYLCHALESQNSDIQKLALSLFGDDSKKTQHAITIRFNQLGLRLRNLKNSKLNK